MPDEITAPRVAVVWPWPTVALFTCIADGVNVGRNAKVVPPKFAPVTWKSGTVIGELLLTMYRGLTDEITGTARTVKLALETAVAPPTMTEIGPLLLPVGTTTCNEVAVAEMTVASVP